MDCLGGEYEADPRQGEKLLEGLGLDSGCKSTATPGLKPAIDKLAEDKLLGADSHTIFRALAARANYLAQDRPDLQFAAKEICRFMAKPIRLSVEAFKRPGRYLEGNKKDGSTLTDGRKTSTVWTFMRTQTMQVACGQGSPPAGESSCSGATRSRHGHRPNPR